MTIDERELYTYNYYIIYIILCPTYNFEQTIIR